MRNPILCTFGGALLALALAAPATAGDLYRWTAPDGSVAFTDDPKRIPEAARGDSERVVRRGLDDYGRYTPSRAPEGEYGERLQARLERLRAINRPVPERQAPRGARSSTILRLDEHTSLALPHEGAADGEAPVVVEERRVRDDNSLTTRHVTVVRQGDEVLSVIKPRSSVGSTNPPGLDEFVD